MNKTITPLKTPPEPGLPTSGWRLRIPLLALAVLSAILPLVAFVRGPLPRWWQRRRRPKGGCTHCGYDLTGNVSGICPECGTQI